MPNHRRMQKASHRIAHSSLDCTLGHLSNLPRMGHPATLATVNGLNRSVKKLPIQFADMQTLAAR